MSLSIICRSIGFGSCFLPRALPPGTMEEEWIKCFSKTYQRDYWFNRSTGDKKWEPPEASAKLESEVRQSLKRSLDEQSQFALVESKKRSVEKVAIIVPFQDAHKEQKRKAQLDHFIPYMTTYLSKSLVDFQIYIIEQKIDEKKFNRGMLLNIGFELARKEKSTVFIFHDVDLLPSEELIDYYIQKPSSPTHIARVWNRYNSNDKYFGGIVAFSEDDFICINGFPNDFWGWGGEDDALIKRVHEMKLVIQHPNKGQVTDLEDMDLKQKLDFLREHKEWKCADKWERLEANEKNWRENGLSDLNFRVLLSANLGEKATKYTVELD